VPGDNLFLLIDQNGRIESEAGRTARPPARGGRRRSHRWLRDGVCGEPRGGGIARCRCKSGPSPLPSHRLWASAPRPIQCLDERPAPFKPTPRRPQSPIVPPQANIFRGAIHALFTRNHNASFISWGRVGRGGSRSYLGREFRTRRRKPVRRVLDRIEAVSPLLCAVRRTAKSDKGPMDQSQIFG
jgi:hypothetical protein